jgi:hypothetical protein
LQAIADFLLQHECGLATLQLLTTSLHAEAVPRPWCRYAGIADAADDIASNSKTQNRTTSASIYAALA